MVRELEKKKKRKKLNNYLTFFLFFFLLFIFSIYFIGNTQPTWLIINVSKITLTDHPLFVTEDYICARLHKVYMNYLTIMRKDHLTYITSKILNLLNNIKIKKNEVIEFGLMEQRQGKHLINLTLELIDYCSQFVEEKEHITNITTNVYRVWKDLKNVRRNAGIICKCIEKKTISYFLTYSDNLFLVSCFLFGINHST